MMGRIRHNAIVVTCWRSDSMDEAAQKAKDIGLQILGPREALLNGYSSMLVCPDGSKEGWEDDYIGEARRKKFRKWLKKAEYEDGSTPYEWVEISYGSEDEDAKIEATAWDGRKK